MNKYTPGAGNIIWDVFPEEFTEAGCFQTFLNHLKSENFEQMILDERNRVKLFLDEWEDQIEEKVDLNHLFLSTPKLSGVLYFSHNTVVSEAFFQNASDQITHPTDRLIEDDAKRNFPFAKDLTFSFPRKYWLEGFANSWGFIRFDRREGGIAMSVTTLDPEVMHLMRKNGFEHLAYLYNQAWNFAIHDYIHHIALYTNPSFAIGKVSPMSILEIEKEIDQWGEDMKDTFNYEYWAHRTHRLITQGIIQKLSNKIIDDADQYFTELSRFQNEMLRNDPKKKDLVEKVGIYLSCIYLWPLHILLHPSSPQMEKIGTFVGRIVLDLKHERLSELYTPIQKANIFSTPFEEMTPLQKGLRATLQDVGFLKICPEHGLTKYQYIRLKTDLIVQRGMYECWHHDHPTLFNKNPMHPHAIMRIFLGKLRQTMNDFANHPMRNQTFNLCGIVPEYVERYEP